MLFVPGLFNHVDQSPLNGASQEESLRHQQARRAGLTA